MATIDIGNTSALGKAALQVELLNRGEESFKHDLREITEGAQADRAAGVAQARRLQLAAQLLLAAEAARLARRDASDARAAALTQGAQLALAHADWLGVEASRATVRVPMVKKTEALLHGRVTDEKQLAAGPVTAQLVDAAGQPVEGVAPVEVDSAGYYALVVPAATAAALPADGRYAVALVHGDESTPARTEPVALAAGVVQLKDIQLAEDELVRLKLRPAAETLRAGTTAAPAPSPAPATRAARKPKE